MQDSRERDIKLSEAMEAWDKISTALGCAFEEVVKALTEVTKAIFEEALTIQKRQGKHKGTRQQFASLNHVKIQHPDFQMKKMSPQVTIRTPIYPVKKII